MTGASSGTGSGSGPPNTASELVNTNLGGAAQRPAALEQRARRVEIHAHADVEVGLGLAADDGREVEDRVGVARDGARDDRRIGEVAGDRRARADRRQRPAGTTSSSTIDAIRRARPRASVSVPRSSSLRARRVPRKPAPPVITMRMAGPS